MTEQLKRTDLLVLPFVGCHITGIVQHVALCDGLFSLGNMDVTFPHGFLWLVYINASMQVVSDSLQPHGL